MQNLCASHQFHRGNLAYDQIYRRQIRAYLPEDLSYLSLDVVALDRSGRQTLGYYVPKPGPAHTIGDELQVKYSLCALLACALGQHAFVLRGAAKPKLRPESKT